MPAAKPAPLSDDESRTIILRYLYNRNRNARSQLGKKAGAAVSIGVLRADLKASQGLKVQQVRGNLNYLMSQGWVEEKSQTRSVPTSRGSVVRSVITYYIISAAGIDKIDGKSEFTRDRFEGIWIEATGQNIITLGDGN